MSRRSDRDDKKKVSVDFVDATVTNEPKDNEPHQKDELPYGLQLPRDLWDRSKPWVLVPEGSLGGHFDWVPRSLRVGPWSRVATLYFTALWLATLALVLYYATSPSAPSRESFHEVIKDVHYPVPYSPQSWYHVLTSFWMLYIIVIMLRDNGPKVWSTFTVQSWTLLFVRHVSAGVACFSQHPRWVYFAELTRFPSACSATTTFFVWNFVVLPFVYYFGLKTTTQRKNFLQFCFSFRLLQLHVGNFIFCVLNQVWASPPRHLLYSELFLAFLSTLLYMTFYLLVLDRIGVHLYPVFSPRARKGLAVLTWTLLLAFYVVTFWCWRYLLRPERTEWWKRD